MNAGGRVGAFLAALLVAAALGAGLGALVGPVDTAPTHAPPSTVGHPEEAPSHGHR